MWLQAMLLQTMSFSWIPMVIPLPFVIYEVTISHVIFGISDLWTYVLLVITFSCQSEWRKTVLCSFLCQIRSFTVLHRLTQLCFTQIILDMGDSHKCIMPSLNRLVHWKVRFSSLNSINLCITVMLICTKNQLHPSRLSWDITKILQTCYFG